MTRFGGFFYIENKMSRFTNPLPQYILENGDLAAGATLAFYESGTDTPISIYSDVNETIAITNPVTLGSRGEVPDIFFSESARCQLRDTNGVQVFDIDPINTGTISGAFEKWNSNIIYSQSDLVYSSTNAPYISIADNNQGNNPTLTPGNNQFWAELIIPQVWNEQSTYMLNQLVIESGIIYKSLIANNTANQPSTDNGTNWKSISDASFVTYNNSSSNLTAVTAQQALDEIVNIINALPSSVVYRGQLDVSAGNAALPSSPVNGDLYVIAVAGTITVSSAGGAPAATAVNVGEQIIYNGDESRWDLIAQVTQAASISYSNTSSGLTASDVQSAIDEVEGRLQTAEGTLSTTSGQASTNAGNISTLQTDVAGKLGSNENAVSASRWATPRNLTVSINGDVVGSGTVSIDGSANRTITFTATVQDDSHSHTIANVDGLQVALDAKANSSHTHTIAQVTGLQSALDGKLGAAANAVSASRLATARQITVSLSGDVTGSANVNFDGSGNVSMSISATVTNNSHTHSIANVSGLQSALDAKMASFVLEDGDGTEVTVDNGKEVKLVEGGNIDINWTDTSPGSDADPFDLTFSVPNASTSLRGAVQLSSATTSTSTTLAATPNAVKTVRDIADGKAPALSGITSSYTLNDTNTYAAAKAVRDLYEFGLANWAGGGMNILDRVIMRFEVTPGGSFGTQTDTQNIGQTVTKSKCRINVQSITTNRDGSGANLFSDSASFEFVGGGSTATQIIMSIDMATDINSEIDNIYATIELEIHE